MAIAAPSLRRQWVAPVVLLSATALAVFWGFYLIDYFWTGGRPGRPAHGPLDQYLQFDPGSITDAVGSLAGILAAVFGIVITVVSIIVQLSATRYSGVARMFLRDPVNLLVTSYYIVACVCGVWLSVSVHGSYVPRAALTGMLVATTGGLVLMAPYFRYVFWFLDPINIIARIRTDVERTVHSGALSENGEQAALAQARALGAMEELADIANSSISGKDKIIAGEAVDALRDLALAYLKHKPMAQPSWFGLGAQSRRNPDFVAMDPESLADLEARRTWLEWKVMRQYLGIYNEALASMRDINYLIAIDTRYLGEAAARVDDVELMDLVFRFMNSYLRASLNLRDVRTSYNVLNQYRLLVEAMLRLGREETAVRAAGYMNYYGRVSFDMSLTFVTETIAYDMSTLCQCARELDAPSERQLLDAFLQLDRPLASRAQEKALLGVRKAQAKLAAYYLVRGEEEKARLICEDMRGEPKERLRVVRDALSSATSKDFWEITDRGRDFEYVPPEQRAKLRVFFEWLGIGTDAAVRDEVARPGAGKRSDVED
ncbi:MAG: DUF2254 domain-containing protein [Polyangiaceae bacterium]|nr:DUF2254 domain-containing protein [Polyangiaceae bacterium]